MRLFIDSMIALMLIAVLVGVIVLNKDEQQDQRDVATVQNALDRLHKQADYHTTLQSATAGQDTLLVHLHVEWFGDDLPTNVLLEKGHPWIDLAPPGDLGTHPPDPVVTDQHQAGFWYNPTLGIFRARVAPLSTEAETLALYNQINQAHLDAFEQIPDSVRNPIAHELGKTPALQYASMANKTWSEPKPKPEVENKRIFAPRADPEQADNDKTPADKDTAVEINKGEAGQPADLVLSPDQDPPSAAKTDVSELRPTLFE